MGDSSTLADATVSNETQVEIEEASSSDRGPDDTVHYQSEQRLPRTPPSPRTQKEQHQMSPSLISPESDSESGSSEEGQELLTNTGREKVLIDRLMGYFFQILSYCRSSLSSSQGIINLLCGKR